MAYKIFTDESLSYICVQTEGELSAEEINFLIADLEFSCRVNKIVNVIVDQTRSTAKKITNDDVHSIALFSIKLNKAMHGGKMAIVLVNDLDYGIARMWESYTSNKLAFESELFRDLQSAKNWLVKEKLIIGT